MEEPDVNYSYDIGAIHVGRTHSWTPFADYPELPVTYSSSDPQILSIDGEGTLKALREGDVLIEASVPETSEYRKSEYSIFLHVLSEADGLYLTDIEQHFYYEGKCYQPGELPLKTERDLCLTQTDLKKYLEEYLNHVSGKLKIRRRRHLRLSSTTDRNTLRKTVCLMMRLEAFLMPKQRPERTGRHMA